MRDGRAHLSQRGHARNVGELGLGGLQRALGPLLIVDVVSRRVPSDHVSVLIAQWHTADKEPAIFAVSPPGALLHFEWLPCRQVSAPAAWSFGRSSGWTASPGRCPRKLSFERPV